jgi:hypothetical protein
MRGACDQVREISWTSFLCQEISEEIGEVTDASQIFL